MSLFDKLLLLFLFGLPVNLVYATVSEFSGNEKLDSSGKYRVSWRIWQENITVEFQVVAATLGYVGFGLSPNGGMTGADILIAGVYPNGSVYSADYHGIGNQAPVLDSQQNWTVTKATENATHTMVVFHRLLDTQDKEDWNITDDTTRLIWAMGKTDNLTHHGGSRGTKSVNLFSSEDQQHFNSSAYPYHEVTTTFDMPGEDTTYWCTIHKMPILNRTHHIIRFEPILESDAALDHTHHFILYRCLAPKDQTEPLNLDSFTVEKGDKGHHCYSGQSTFMWRCMGNLITAWSKGGQAINFPENVGLPFQENPGQQEYWGLEVHYDNPYRFYGKTVTTGVRFYYTDKLREHEAGLMRVEHYTDVSLTVPPNSKDFVIAGHCSETCTDNEFPSQGINIFNVLLHSHMAGRKLKLRHFRGTQELEVIAKDDNYDFDFQQSRALTKFKKVLPGDQMTVECTYESGSKAVVGGLSTREEMCQGWFFYYPRQKMTFCGSMQLPNDHFSLLGITETKHKESYYAGGLPSYSVEKPENLKGDYIESASYKVNWTKEFREYYQREKRFGSQVAYCGKGMEIDFAWFVAYPAFPVWKFLALGTLINGLLGLIVYVYKKKVLNKFSVMKINPY